MGSEQVGVHWHIADGVQVRYGSVDPDRGKIKWVEASYPDGSSRRYEHTRISDDTPILEELERDCVLSKSDVLWNGDDSSYEDLSLKHRYWPF